MKYLRFAALSLAMGVLLTSGPGVIHAQSKSNKASPKRGERITLDFANAEIEAVARTMATITGRNVVVDPRVKGTMSLSSDGPVTPQAAFNQFLAALRLQGFTVVETSGLYKVVPEADAKIQGGAVSVGQADGTVRGAGNQIATRIYKLNFESANNLVPILRPLISPNNTINVNPGNNSLVITDYVENLQRMGRIIEAMDVSNATDLEIIPLRHGIASDLAPLVTRLLESGGGAAGGQPDTSYRTTIVAETRSNSLIVRAANASRISLVRSLVARLDQPSSTNPLGNIYVVYLKNADATKLAATLRATLSGEVRSAATAAAAPTAAPTGTATGATAAVTSSTGAGAATTGGQIQADPATNSLIITAPEPQYRQLRAVIDKLDGRRAQVYVESLIAEVNADRAAQFGIQWQGALGKSGNGVIGLLGTNFGTGANNILSLATSAANGTLSSPGPGLNAGLLNRTNGVYVLGALANFLQTNGDGNILSTPNLLTLDNEEAKIIIGQNVPFVTGQFTNTGGTGGAVNPFQTIERKDVGLTLRVKPQISENGTIKMAIFQEVSSVQASSVNSTTGLITNKRAIESNVLVDDGSIVVLGGLLSDEYSGSQDQVPVLGDVPLLGNLFKNQSRSRKKTNLMVFLRPTVVRDASATEQLSLDRYDLMRKAQSNMQPAPSSVMPINEVPLMPARGANPAIAPQKPQ